MVWDNKNACRVRRHDSVNSQDHATKIDYIYIYMRLLCFPGYMAETEAPRCPLIKLPGWTPHQLADDYLHMELLGIREHANGSTLVLSGPL